MMSASLFRAMLLASALGCAGPSFAQQTHNDDAESELDAVVEPPKAPPVKVEPAGAADLRDAIRRIAVRPNDSYALADAGYASLKLGDATAAYNFFVKANTLQPSDARIKSGLAQALVRKENPFEALRYFDEAQRLGASERSFALDRALAYDLLGNFERAQQDYQLARTFGTSDETITRHAISLSLSGKASEADVMLGPLLERDNMEAWRARSFMLAARGDTREAGKIAAAFMPEAEVRRLDYYFRQMPKLTPAQQAAALHFGHFPTNGNIGRDSQQIQQIAAASPPKPAPVAGGDRLTPSGTPLGPKQGPKDSKQGAAKAKAAKDQKEQPKAVAVKSESSDQKSGKKPKEDKDKKSKDAVVPPVRTASAQAAIDKAKVAKRGVVINTPLPTPDKAAPKVSVSKPVATIPTPVSQPAQTDVVVPTPSAPPVVKPATVATATPAPVSAGFESLETAKAQPSPAIPAPVIPAPAMEQPKVDVIAAILPPVSAEQNKPDPVPASAGPVTATPTSVATQIPQPQGPNLDGTPLRTAVEPVALPPIATAQPASQAEPVPSPKTAENAPGKPFDLGAVVASIEIPDSEQQAKVVPVDIKKIKPQPAKTDPASSAKGDTAKDAKAKAAQAKANAARHWVQIATGSDMNGLAFDFRRMAKKSPALFDGKEGWTAAWGKSRRLLVGPFDDMKSAKKWETDFRKSGGDGFAWKSAEGEVVDKLKGK